MNAFRAFFSFVEHGSGRRFGLALLICLVALELSSYADYRYGLAANAIAGGVAGASVAKMVTEAVRWLRPSRSTDGRDGWGGGSFAAACIALGVVILGGIAFISISMRQDADRIEAWRAAKEHRNPDR